MLFDLRSPGRKRVVQITYLFLAILIGGGLVLVGFGGGGGGGLLDALQSGGGSNDPISQKADKLDKQVAKNPQNVQAWDQLARTRYQVATQDYNQQTGKFSKDGQKQLVQSAQAWEKYLSLKPAKPNANTALFMTQVYAYLDKPEKGVSTQEIVVQKFPTAANYYKLAIFYYLNSNARLGDLAASKAVALAPKEQRSQVKKQLASAAQIPQQKLQQQFQQQQGQNLPFEGSSPFSGPSGG